MKKKFVLTVFLATMSWFAFGQTLNLQQLLKENKFNVVATSAVPLTDGDKKGITTDGNLWLKGVTFSQGTIDVDIRGRDVMQRSFLGIAFHAVDTGRYDLVYFRPFNFQSKDSIRRIHAVQYTYEPDFPWHKLREERNGIYEKAVNPAPLGKDWFHATIVVEGKTVTVYVNHSKTPSLVVEKLSDNTSGMIALHAGRGFLPGDFANLVIKHKK
jgi:hypothetical protein